MRGSFYNRLMENIRALPGVESAAAASGLPLGNNGWQTSFVIDGQPVPPREQIPLMEACLVTPDYFKAMNIPVLRGRVFTDRDDRSHLAGRDLSKMNENERSIAGLNSIVIDEEFARRHWPNEDPVGKRVKLGQDPDAPKLEVLGVVGRVKMESLNQNSDRVQGYFPFNQVPQGNMTVIIKGASDPNQLISSARNAVNEIDPDQPIYSPRTMGEIRAESVAGREVDTDAAEFVCRNRAGAGDRWNLRRDVLLGYATNARDRNSHGHRGASTRRVQDDPGPWNEARADRRWAGVVVGVFSDTVYGRDAVRR